MENDGVERAVMESGWHLSLVERVDDWRFLAAWCAKDQLIPPLHNRVNSAQQIHQNWHAKTNTTKTNRFPNLFAGLVDFPAGSSQDLRFERLLGSLLAMPRFVVISQESQPAVAIMSFPLQKFVARHHASKQRIPCNPKMQSLTAQYNSQRSIWLMSDTYQLSKTPSS